MSVVHEMGFVVQNGEQALSEVKYTLLVVFRKNEKTL